MLGFLEINIVCPNALNLAVRRGTIRWQLHANLAAAWELIVYMGSRTLRKIVVSKHSVYVIVAFYIY